MEAEEAEFEAKLKEQEEKRQRRAAKQAQMDRIEGRTIGPDAELEA